jgi:hypothetical protein
MLKQLVCVVGIIAAQPVQAGNFVIGSGTASCGTWTQARKAQSTISSLLAQWVAGYLSSANVNDSSPSDILKDQDYDGLMAWVDKYCQENPLDVIGTAAQKLLEELLVRQDKEPKTKPPDP